MKYIKITAIILFMIAFASSSNSQTKPVQPTAKPLSGKNTLPQGNNNKNIIIQNAGDEANAWVEIYELPDYQGRMVKFTKTTSSPTLPFTPDRISIKRGSSIIKKVKIFSGPNSELIEVKQNIPNLRVNNGGIILIEFESLPYVEIFEFPDFRGRSVKFVDDIFFKNNLDLPFPLENISVKNSSDDVISYFSYNCTGKKKYITVDRNKQQVTLGTHICGLRIGKKEAIRMKFNGILAQIHNNDCKRMYGIIKYRIIEKDVSGNVLSICKNIDERRTDEWGWVTLFQKSKNESIIPANLYNIDNYFIKERSKTAAGQKPFLFRPPLNEDLPYEVFLFDALTYDEGNLKLEISINIGTHHKSCDLCSDYTDNASMINEYVQEYTIKREQNLYNIQPGKFRSASGVGGFTGPEHATYLDFTFATVGYNFYRSKFPYR